MMETFFSRSELLLGRDSTALLSASRIAVFGLGGVGSWAVEALARSAIGSFLLVDSDTVAPSNCNRQLVATHSTVGCLKVAVMKDRVLDINPVASVEIVPVFIGPDTIGSIDFSTFDYVLDCIDTVSAKLLIAERCQDAGTPLLSCMGTGNRIRADGFVITDIGKTKTCPLARVMRRELKKRGIQHLQVLYSPDEYARARSDIFDNERPVPGSVSFVPPVAGLLLAGELVRQLLEKYRTEKQD